MVHIIYFIIFYFLFYQLCYITLVCIKMCDYNITLKKITMIFPLKKALNCNFFRKNENFKMSGQYRIIYHQLYIMFQFYKNFLVKRGLARQNFDASCLRDRNILILFNDPRKMPSVTRWLNDYRD